MNYTLMPELYTPSDPARHNCTGCVAHYDRHDMSQLCKELRGSGRATCVGHIYIEDTPEGRLGYLTAKLKR